MKPENCPSCDAALRYGTGQYLVSPPITHAYCDYCKNIYDYTEATDEFRLCSPKQKQDIQTFFGTSILKPGLF